MSDNEQPQSPGARELQEQAIEWIVNRHVAETWSEHDQSRLDAWLNKSPAHLVAYWRAKDGWNRTELLGALRSFRPDRTRTEGRQRTRALWTRRAAVAAAFVIVGATASGYFSRPVEHRYATALGGRQMLALADGSQIEMNTDTALRIGDAGTQRTVTLEKGEAFFQIKHDSKHPFVVRVANHRIVDLGTKFSVRTDGDRVQVALVEGLARIDNFGADGKRSSTLLKPGDVAVATALSIFVSKKSQPELVNQLAWRHGVLVFDNAALADVAAEFNRYNHQKIVIADQAAGRRTINGAFQANDLEAMTNIAREVFGLRVVQRNDEILISR
jgi:transmembrane sensor